MERDMSIGEIFEKVEKAETEEERVQLLKKHSTDVGFLSAIQLACDSRVVFDLPEGVPPFKDEGLREGLTESNLRVSMKKMYIFIKDHPQSKGIAPWKREAIFVELLESIGPKDRSAILQIKDRKVPWLTKDLLEKASLPALVNVLPNFTEQIVAKEEPKPKKRGRRKKVSEPTSEA